MKLLTLLLCISSLSFGGIFYSTPFKDSFKNVYSMPFGASMFDPSIGDSASTVSSSCFNYTNLSPFSISVWHKDGGSISAAFVGRNAPGIFPIGYDFGVFANQKYFFHFISNGATGAGISTVTNSTYLADQWNHAVLTYSGSGVASGVKVYLNGSVLTETISLDTLGTFNGQSLQTSIGKSETGVGTIYYNTGNLDEISIWSVALSAGQVTAIYNNGRGYDLPQSSAYQKLDGWYRMGDVNDNTGFIYDRKGSCTMGTSIASSGWAYQTDVP